MKADTTRFLDFCVFVDDFMSIYTLLLDSTAAQRGLLAFRVGHDAFLLGAGRH